MKIYLNGQLVGKEQAVVSVFDHGLLYGDGVFEGIRVYGGNVFLLKDHIERLYESAKAIRLEIPISPPAMIQATKETVAANGITDGYVRLVVTRGAGSLGLDIRRTSPPNTRPNDRPTYNDAHRMRKGTNDRHNNTNRATRAIMRGTWPTTAPPGRTDAIGATRWAMQATPAHFRTSAGNAQHESSPTTTVSSPERLPTSTEYSGKSRHGSTRTGHGVHFALFVNGPHNTTLRENTPRNHKSTSLTTLLKHHNRSLPKHRNCAPTCRDVNHPRICTSGTTT